MGDLGGGNARDEQPLAHRRLEERALREGWTVPNDVRIKVLKRLAGVVDPETEEGAAADLRYVIAAAKTIAAADLRQQAIDLAKQKLTPPHHAESTPRIVIPGSPRSQGRSEDQGSA